MGNGSDPNDPDLDYLEKLLTPHGEREPTFFADMHRPTIIS